MMRIILVFLGIKGEQRSVLQVKSLGHLSVAFLIHHLRGNLRTDLGGPATVEGEARNGSRDFRAVMATVWREAPSFSPDRCLSK